MPIQQPNQLYLELMGISGLNPYDGEDSASRKQMFATHLGQALVVEGSTERYIQTGLERELSKYTFSIKMPVTGVIIKIIDRYQTNTIGKNTISENPSTIVIYEDSKTKEIGIIELKRFCSLHQHFGFPYKATQHLSSKLRVGAEIQEGTVLLDSPSVTEDGGYKFGVQANVAFMGHPAVAEDGILVNRDVLKKFKIKTYETRIVEFGKDYYPLNTYGTTEVFKAFPDIGEYLHENNLLMALRKYDPNLAPVQQNIYDLMEVDYFFDRTIYGAHGRGKVIDIRVHHDASNSSPPTPAGMELQAKKYDDARRTFYREILYEHQRLSRLHGKNLKVTPEFHALLVEATSVVGDSDQRIIKMCGKNPLDDWRIEFVIEYEITPSIGFKFTDCHGGRN